MLHSALVEILLETAPLQVPSRGCNCIYTNMQVPNEILSKCTCISGEIFKLDKVPACLHEKSLGFNSYLCPQRVQNILVQTM